MGFEMTSIDPVGNRTDRQYLDRLCMEKITESSFTSAESVLSAYHDYIASLNVIQSIDYESRESLQNYHTTKIGVFVSKLQGETEKTKVIIKRFLTNHFNKIIKENFTEKKEGKPRPN